MHKIEFCCPTWLDLAQYGTPIYHSRVSTRQNYKMHLENEMKIPNSLCVWKFFKFGKFPGIATLFLKLAEDDNTWLDYKPSPRRLSICLSQRKQQTIAAQSVTPKYHHWMSCFYFLFKCLKVLRTYSVFSAHRLTTWMDYKPSSSFEHNVCERQYLASE